MSDVQYTEQAQGQINEAEDKLAGAIDQFKRGDSKEDVAVEIEPEKEELVSVEVEEQGQQEPEQPKRPRRSDFVETDDPKVLERINDLYGQVKKSDSRNQMLIEHNRQLEEKLSQHINRLNSFEDDYKSSESNRVEQELKTQLKEAREEGDNDLAYDIEDKLLSLRLERRVGERMQPKEPENQQAQQPQVDQQTLRDMNYIASLSEEKDSSGNQVRPWLMDWHPDNEKAVGMFHSIPQELAAAGKSADVASVMRVLDERMNGPKRDRNAQPAVLSDNGSISSRNIVKLTSEEAAVARKMGLTNEAYAKQKQLLSS